MPSRRRGNHIPNVLWRAGWAHLRMKVDGRAVWRSLGTRDWTEARERAVTLMARHLAGEDVLELRPRPGGLSLIELRERWSAMRAAELRTLTRESHLRRWRAFEAWAEDQAVSTLAEVTPEFLMRYRAACGRSHAAATVATELRAVRSIVNFAVRMGWLDRSPFDRLPRAPRVARAERPLLTRVQGERLLALAAPTRFADVIPLAIFEGLRRGELMHLRREDVDRARREVHLVNRPPEFQLKSYEARSVPLARRVDRLLSGRGRGPIWRGGCSPARFSGAAGDLIGQADIGGGIHALRHSWVSYLLLLGVPVAQVMAWAGHAALATTQGYTHVRQRIDPADVAWFREQMGL